MKYVWHFILMLIITWIVLALYSFSNTTIKIAGIELKKTGIKNFFKKDTARIDALAAYIKPYKRQELDTTKQNILLIGDSMLEKFGLAFKDYCDYNGHTLHIVIWYSAQSKWFGTTDTLKYFINKFKPSYIFLVLGANELFVPNIKDTRAEYVKRIVSMMQGIPFVWVGPPNWRKDTGINDLIRRYAGETRYFPTYKISMNNPRFTRYKDGAHPRPQGARLWMDSLAVWVMTKSRHPILLNKPPEYKTTKLPHGTVLLQPLKE